MMDHSIQPRSARRGAAMMMALFALVVVGTATLAFTASRRTGVLVTRNIDTSMRVRQLATSGLEVAKAIMHSDASAWRTNHDRGVLLQDYALDGGTVTVRLIDIAKRQAGASAAASMPDDTTTQVEIAVTASVDGSTWTSVANTSIPTVTKGQYAIFVNRMLRVDGTDNEIGRWKRAPKSTEKRRINLGTMATSTTMSGEWQSWKGVWLDSDLVVESEVLPLDPEDLRSSKSTWVYYPYAAGTESTRSGLGTFTVSGPGASKVATNRMSSDESIRMKPSPAPTPTVPTLPTLTGGDTITGGSRTLYPFRVGTSKGKGNTIFTTNGCTLTFTSGTYEIYGSWKANGATIRIQGSVRLVVSPSGNSTENENGNSPQFTGIDWNNTSVELLEGADLEINNGYSLNMTGCWIGGYYQCLGEQDATNATGDPHKRAWMGGGFQATACDSTLPDEPRYFEPWHIRVYPIGSLQSPNRIWTLTDTSVIGSLFLPTSSVVFAGKSQLYGRIAADSVTLGGTSRVRYDHALDDLSGLTEGRAPNRGGDPDQIFPIRLLRWGPDRGTAP